MTGLLRGLARVAPFAIIAGLIGSVFLARLEPTVAPIETPAIHPRDRFVAIATPAPDVLWLVSLDGKIVRSDDAGRSWRIQRPAGRSVLQDMVAWSADAAVAVGAEGTILTTADGGTSWIERPADLPQLVRLLHVGRDPVGRLWVTGERSTLLVSDDGGRTFAARGDGRDVGFNDVAFTSASVGWVVGEFGDIRRTTDGGASWSDVPPADASLLATAACDHPGRGIAVGLQGRMRLTEDGGATWSDLPPATPEHLFDVTCADGRFVAVGDRGAIVQGDTGTRTAHPLTVPGAPSVWRVAVRPQGDRLLLAGAASGVIEGGRYHALAR